MQYLKDRSSNSTRSDLEAECSFLKMSSTKSDLQRVFLEYYGGHKQQQHLCNRACPDWNPYCHIKNRLSKHIHSKSLQSLISYSCHSQNIKYAQYKLTKFFTVSSFDDMLSVFYVSLFTVKLCLLVYNLVIIITFVVLCLPYSVEWTSTHTTLTHS